MNMRVQLRALEHPVKTARLARFLWRPGPRFDAVSQQAVQIAMRVAKDKALHEDARRAFAGASDAARRTQRIGIENALTDKRVLRHLEEARIHATKVANRAARRERRRRGRMLALLLVGSAVAGAAYAKWNSDQPAAQAF
jgi:hypothetical protein